MFQIDEWNKFYFDIKFQYKKQEEKKYNMYILF